MPDACFTKDPSRNRGSIRFKFLTKSKMVYEASILRKLVTEPNCKTRSTRHTDLCCATRQAAKLVAAVVEPTPPLFDETAITCPRSFPFNVWTSIFFRIASNDLRTSLQVKGCVRNSSAPERIARKIVSGAPVGEVITNRTL